MSKSSPPEPPPLKLDDCISVFVTFTTIISLLYYWALNKKNDKFRLEEIESSPPSPQPKSAPEALPTQKPTTTAPESLSLSLTTSKTNPTRESSSHLSSIKQSKPQASQKSASPDSALDSAVSTPIPAAPTPTSAVEFSDVSASSWATPSITRLNKRKIMVGFPDHSFRPNKFATRGEFAALLKKIFDPKNRQNAINFNDLHTDYWASDAIQKVSKAGLLKGYPAKDFRPDQPVTRAEVLVALATALNLKTPSTPAKTLQIYQDADQVLDYAIAKVAAAQEAGLVVGYPKEKLLVPNKPATRAEMAAMFYQALAKSEKEQKVGTRF
ncbi:S-layer homology domain-containing protein [Allocoleopsis sp.]|uniref:S-layer homology domain-containing protein n=1 Tax=Allocoleopsis sp. TaxID=3088169 RepID=UPI002FD3A1AF